MREAQEALEDIAEEIAKRLDDLYRSIRGLPPRRPAVVPIPVRVQEDRRRR